MPDEMPHSAFRLTYGTQEFDKNYLKEFFTDTDCCRPEDLWTKKDLSTLNQIRR